MKKTRESHAVSQDTETGTPFFRRSFDLTGVVQAIGMRPALFRMAQALHLRGSVENLPGMVRLILYSQRQAVLQDWERRFGEFLPKLAQMEIAYASPLEVVAQMPDAFTILAPDAQSARRELILTPPDLAPCPRCRQEYLYDEKSRHFHDPFTACGECGPRSSVIAALPYERANSAWRNFPLCEACRQDYENPNDRRFHIQGISCRNCSPQLHFSRWDATKTNSPACATSYDAIIAAANLLAEGKILALKGIGGFQLLTDASKPEAVQRLRQRKQRPHQPLALLGSSLEAISQVAQINATEQNLLTSQAAPIVLLAWRDDFLSTEAGRNIAKAIAPDGAYESGFMLAASPLHDLVMKELETRGIRLVVATSGNIHDAPPALSVSEANVSLHGIADGILSHDREILRRYDDSLMALQGHGLQPQVWRRSRGWSGNVTRLTHFHRERTTPAESVLAMGGDLKSTYAATVGNELFLSPHYGDLADFAAFQHYETSLRRTLSELPELPHAILTDLHPEYVSRRLGEELAQELKIPVVSVQHHEAHALAAMAELGLHQARVLVFDGTGMGTDGTLWGAELFVVDREARKITRVASFAPAPLPGGDLAIHDVRRQFWGRLAQLGKPFSESETGCSASERALAEGVFQMVHGHWNSPPSCSAGRLFDAVAGALQLAPEMLTYEGQAAVRLETQARMELRQPAVRSGASELVAYQMKSDANGFFVVDWSRLFQDLTWRSQPQPALWFHRELAGAATEMCRIAAVERVPESVAFPVVLTGGVFQNRTLCALLEAQLSRDGIPVHFPQDLPPNDGAISIGQIFMHRLLF